MKKIRVLFVCNHNSARSQMAEAFLNYLAGDRFEAESAGLEPGKLNPNVVKVMHEESMDISQNKTKDVFDFYKQGKHFDYVITVCDESKAEQCPFFPSQRGKIHWSFNDPSTFTGTHEEILAQVRTVRDAIKKQIENFISQ